ncbi:MAG TPA: hypothetical protein VFO44_00095, partial [Steroidobacteraceae bacterium]|nr:hypothetical protein [Steroidobacteraceae bacterium]
RDYEATLAMRPQRVGGARSVLVVGNSLLLQGVVRGQLRDGLAPAYDVEIFPIEGTTYLDWLFGLQRLFDEGARPAVVIVCMNFGQLTSDATHGAEFAYQLMRGRDLLRVKAAAGLDLMTTSNYFFAHNSAWFGLRSHLRAGLLEKLLPGTEQLAPYLAPVQTSRLPATRPLLGAAVQRLRQLEQLSTDHGAHFVMLLPPSLSPTDAAPEVAELAARQGIPVLVPFGPAEMPAAAFSDGFHLDPRGAELFTSRLQQELSSVLASLVN